MLTKVIRVLETQTELTLQATRQSPVTRASSIGFLSPPRTADLPTTQLTCTPWRHGMLVPSRPVMHSRSHLTRCPQTAYTHTARHKVQRRPPRRTHARRSSRQEYRCRVGRTSAPPSRPQSREGRRPPCSWMGAQPIGRARGLSSRQSQFNQAGSCLPAAKSRRKPTRPSRWSS